MDQLRNWLEQLSDRERALVISAGALVVFAIVFMLGMRPLINSSERNREIVNDKLALLTELEQLARRIGPQTKNPSGTPFFLTRSLRHQMVKMK